MSDSVTINLNGIDLEVVGNYDKGEPTVMYYSDMSGHPGTPPSFEIQYILLGSKNIMPILEALDVLEEIEKEALKKY